MYKVEQIHVQTDNQILMHACIYTYIQYTAPLCETKDKNHNEGFWILRENYVGNVIVWFRLN